MKDNENVYFRARKEAAKYNERLSSREGAAELLGVSASTLADYELGNTKAVPVDKVWEESRCHLSRGATRRMTSCLSQRQQPRRQWRPWRRRAGRKPGRMILSAP